MKSENHGFFILSFRPFHSVTPFFSFARIFHRTSMVIMKDALKSYLVCTKINIFCSHNWSSFFLNQYTDVGLLTRKYSSAFIIYKIYVCAFHIITNCLLACNLNLTSLRNLYTFLFIAEFEQHHHAQSFLCLADSEQNWIPN